MINIIISATNLVEGGPLSILNSLLSSLNDYIGKTPVYKVIAIVYDKDLCYYPNIEYIEIKWAKKNWFFRLYSEYFYLNRLSKSLDAHLWLSLHDTTPNVKAHIRAVYCHNPTPFYKPSIIDVRFSYKEYLFSLFYRFLYQINIKKNDYVIVQQNWMREKFCKIFNLNPHKVIVAYPERKASINKSFFDAIDNRQVLFFFPAYPRTFKNFEVICKSCELLKKQGFTNYKVALTMNGKENRYAKYIYNKYKDIHEINFLGIIDIQKVFELYAQTNCLLFPSKLETWGLPISEFSLYNRPMIIADLPYAHETASNANCVSFFPPDDHVTLSQLMKDIIENRLIGFEPVHRCHIDDPFVDSWAMLINKLVNTK